ncbi:MAG: hypothetical protein QXW52_09200 [Candidatus Caldarchaeum sp.]
MTEYQLLRDSLERVYRELVTIESQLHPLVTRLRQALGAFLSIEEIEPVAEAPKVEETAKIRIDVPTTMAVAPVQPAAAARPEPRIQLVEPIRYRIHKFAIAPNPITFAGSNFDLGETYDTVIIVPTIDTQIEIDKPVESTTPVIFALTSFNLDNVAVRTIYYKGVSTTLTGRLVVFAFKYH